MDSVPGPGLRVWQLSRLIDPLQLREWCPDQPWLPSGFISSCPGCGAERGLLELMSGHRRLFPDEMVELTAKKKRGKGRMFSPLPLTSFPEVFLCCVNCL